MVIELAGVRVAAGAERHLIAERPTMLAALRARFPACLAGYLSREDDGSFLDVPVWRDRAAAEKAARLAHSVPECAAWFARIASSGGLRHVEVVDAWPGAPGGEVDARS